MVVRYRDILELITVLSDEKGLQVTVSESLKGGLITGGFATVGGIVFGPPGLAIGGTIGGCIATYLTGDSFRPMSQAVSDMSERDKQRLTDSVQNIISGLDAGDAMELIALVQGNQLLKAKVMGEMVTFMRSQMNFHVHNDF